MREPIRPVETRRIKLQPPKASASGATPLPRFRGEAVRTRIKHAREDQAKTEIVCGELLASIYDAVLITNGAGEIFEINPRSMEFFLYDHDELCGMNILDLISGADSGTLKVIVENLRNRKYALVGAMCRRRDGSGFPAEVAISRVNWRSPDDLCCTVRDLTVRKQAEKALKEALERLEERDRARLLLVSNVSHELRTPVTSMAYGISNVLRGVAGPVPENLKAYLERFQRDCRRLLTTANEILDLSALESKTMKLARVKTPLARLVRRAVEIIEHNAAQKNVEVTFEPPATIDTVCCDPVKAERVFLNIVGNAAKYTPSGGAVKVQMRRDPELHRLVQVIVTDTGVGIPESAIARVTERYYRVGAQADGAGLGLAISKEIIEMHGGSLEIVSPPPGAQRGTRVTVSFETCPPVVVLVVSANVSLVDTVRKQVGAWGMLVNHARTIPEIDAAAELAPPDVLAVDLAVDGLQGTDSLSSAGKSSKVEKVPRIALSAEAVSRDTRDALKGMAILLLAESWSEFSLLDAIDGALAAGRSLDTCGDDLQESRGSV